MMLPPFAPYRVELIYLTGVLELFGVIGVWIPRLTRLMGFLLILMLIGLLPANVYSAIKRVDFGGHGAGPAYLLVRVPFQLFVIWWTYFATEQDWFQRKAKPNKSLKLTANVSRSVVIGVAICFGLLLVPFLSSSVRAQGTIGHVLDVEGDWYLDSRRGQALRKGDELPSSGVIRIPSPSRYASIVIVYDANNEIVKKHCRNAGECEQPILLPRAVQRQLSRREILLGYLMKAVRLNRAMPSVNAGRSDDGPLAEAIVQTKDGAVDLAPVFVGLNSGTYYLQIERVVPEGKDGEGGDGAGAKPKGKDGEGPGATPMQGPIEVKWDVATRTSLPIVKLTPGLFEIELLEKRDTTFTSTLTTAWFLAVNPEQHEKALAQFSEVKELTLSWKDLNEETRRGFLRAFLSQLATGSAESQPPQPVKQ